MSSFTSVYTSLPSLYPSLLSSCPSTFAAAFPSSFPRSHPIHSAQHPPPHTPPPPAPLTAYFCLICPHCKVDCYQRGESKEGPGSVSVIVIFNVINFNFQSFPAPTPVLQPPPLLSWRTHHGNLSILFLCVFLSHSFWLPLSKHLLAIILSHVFPDFCYTECNFPPAASVMRSKWKIINIWFKKKWSCVSYFKYCHFPLRVLVCHWDALSHLHIRGMQMITFFPVTAPSPPTLMAAYVCMCMRWACKNFGKPDRHTKRY